ncbi:MAG: hypothetical protein GX846_09725, partial [Deltaproteobacteria bacterium]|nr:hypothetical protein [Deltaproteobacteria bacterium]
NIQTRKGSGKVIRNNVLKEAVTILLDSDEEVDVLYSEIITVNKPVEEEEPDTNIVE